MPHSTAWTTSNSYPTSNRIGCGNLGLEYDSESESNTNSLNSSGTSTPALDVALRGLKLFEVNNSLAERAAIETDVNCLCERLSYTQLEVDDAPPQLFAEAADIPMEVDAPGSQTGLMERSPLPVVQSEATTAIRESQLPAEILGEVFIIAAFTRHLPVGSHTTPFATLAPASPLIIITKVSSFWRTTALALPELWNRVAIEYGPGSALANHPGAMANLLELWVKRSVIRDIHLAFCPFSPPHQNPLLRCSPSGSPQHVDSVVVDVLIRHRWRIASLHLAAPKLMHGESLAPILNICARFQHHTEDLPILHFPALTSLHLSANLHPIQNRVGLREILTFNDALHIKRLSLDLEPSCPRGLQLNWESLTELDMLSNVRGPLHRSRWINLIRLCSNLCKGRFWLTSKPILPTGLDDMVPTLMGAPNNVLEDSTPFTLAFLEELVIEYEGSDSLSSLFHNLSFDKLQVLDVHAEAGSQFFNDCLTLGDHTVLQGQLTGADVRELSLSGVCMTHESLTPLLSVLKELRVLKVKFPPNVAAEEFMKSLYSDSAGIPSGEIMIPNLKRMSIWVNRYVPASSATYLDMVRSRVGRLSEGRAVSSTTGLASSKFEVLDVYVDDSKQYDPATGQWAVVYPTELLEDEELRPFIQVHCVSRFTRL